MPHAYELCTCMCVYTARKRTHSDRRDYEVGLRGEKHISFLVIINVAKNVAKTCSAFGKYIPASNGGSGFCSLYRYLLFAFLLSSCILSSPSTLGLRRASFFPSRPVARSSLPPPPPRPFFDHRRCYQTTTCTPGPGQLPSCGHPFPSIFLSRSHSALGLSRPLRRVILPPPCSLYPRAVIYLSSSLLPLYFFSLDTRRHIHRLLTAVRHVLLQRFPQCCIVIISMAISFQPLSCLR